MKLEEKIELEAQAIQIDVDEENYGKYPKGYLDGMLWAYDLVLMWIRNPETMEA